MLTQYLLAFLWGIVVLIAFVGYGRFINAVLSPKNKFDLGMQAVFGLALSVVIGGFLNFAGVISVFSIQILIIIGILLFLIFCPSIWDESVFRLLSLIDLLFEQHLNKNC